MEQLFLWGGAALKLLLAGAVALLPGTIVWLALLGLGLVVRRFKGGELFGSQDEESVGTLPCCRTDTIR